MQSGPVTAQVPANALTTSEWPSGFRPTAAGVRRFVQLPTDAERSAASGYEVASTASVTLALPGSSLGPAWQQELLGALVAVLYRYTQQATIAVDIFVGDRPTNPIALDVDVAGDSSVSSIIEDARVALAVARSLPSDDAGGPSNIAATLIAASSADTDSFAPAAGVVSPSAPYDVNFTFAQTKDATLLAVTYNAKLIHSSTVDRLIESYRTLVGAALEDQAATIDQLPLLSPGEIRALTIEQDSGTATYPSLPFVGLFEALAKSQPAALAVSFQEHRITYRELDERSNQVAHYLIGKGVGPEVAVAVCVRPSLDVTVAILAIWKARGIYLPLDPTHPEALVARMLDEAQPRAVLTSSSLTQMTKGFPRLCLDTDTGVLETQPVTAPDVEPSLSDPACLFYTSGTTGKAKGVVSTQGNLAQYIHSAAQKYGFSRDDVFSSLARFTFSISLFELISPLCAGGRLRILDRDEVLTPERLFRALEEVTVLHAGPSLLGSLFRHLRSAESAPRSLPRMRHASSGGDMVPPSIMEEMKRVFPNAELFVIYGCTEISCMGTTFPIRRDTTVSRTFVGKPFPDVTVRVLDSQRNLVPFGVVGEICFAGKGIVRGYLDRPELTADKFAEIFGRRFYRTGDMGRLHPDGNVEILGRRDFQVQLRGIRIELAGIEKTVQELGLAAQCAVVARTLQEGDVRLVAFVVKPSDENAAGIRRALAKELPDYMVPNHVVVLDGMPLTANGKLDRNRLKEIPWEAPVGARSGIPPANDRERKVAEVFARVLGIAEVGMEDSFFDLGGDSLLGVVALDEIERAIGVAIPPHVLFESGTVRALANHTEGDGPGESRPILLNAKSPGPPLFMLSGIHIYRDLAKRLDGRCSAYGVFTRREMHAFDPSSGSHSIEELARDYVAIIRREQPVGPYRLLGFSFAGLVAYEVARQLRVAGEQVPFLALIDAALPEWTEGWRFRLSQLGRLVSAPQHHVGAFIWRRFTKKKGATGIEYGRYTEDARLGPIEGRRDAANRDAAAEYMAVLTPFAGEVTLIVSGERLRNDPLKSPNCGWEPYIASLDVHTVDTGHFGMLSDDPYVSEVARILTTGMQRTSRPA